MTSRLINKLERAVRDTSRRTRAQLTTVARRSPYNNVLHCCVHRTGSQWLRAIFEDPLVYKFSGLRAYHYQSHMPGNHDPRPIGERRFHQPFPGSTIVSPLYIGYENYRAIPQPGSARAFFVMRDPRDVVVSWYFSAKKAHRLMGDLAEVRERLNEVDPTDGLCYSIKHLAEFGLFEAQRSWAEAPADSDFMIVRYEELTGPDSRSVFTGLLGHCGIDMPADGVDTLLATHGFQQMSGRKPGDEDQNTHYRKGVAGDWRNHFNEPVQQAFDQAAPGLVTTLGYTPG